MSILSAKSSAPGKAIIFGEHAVVHGVTAIAAALSDLRIYVTIVSSMFLYFLFDFFVVVAKACVFVGCGGGSL